MGSTKHKHKSRKRKHYRSSDSSERETERKDHEREKYRQHSSKKHKDKGRKEKDGSSSSKAILVDDYISSSSDDDVIIVTAPPPPKISRRSSPPRRASPPPAPKRSSKTAVASPPPPPPPKISRRRSVTPPPPKISRHRSPSPPPPPENGTYHASLSVEETNKMRLELGLKPLSVGNEKPQTDDTKEKKETFGGVDMGDFVHRPPVNIAAKTKGEKLNEKIQLHRERRAQEEKLRSIRKLGEEDDDDDDATKWVEKNRKIISEKEQAEKRAKELDAMDEVFGLGELIEENIRATKQVAYTARDLKGLKVEHDMETFKEGRDVVLTLKDANVLDAEGDSLVNVNMLDDERYKKNIDRRRQKVGYNAYTDDLTEMELALENNVLSKYDEEIDGEKRSSFTLGISAQVVEEARKESIRNRLQELSSGKRLENLTFTLQPASEYFTDQEIAVKFKKPKKRVRKIRKVKPLKADDLLADAPLPSVTNSVKRETRDPAALLNGGSSSADKKVKREIKSEPLEEDDDGFALDTDDLPPPEADTPRIRIEDDEDDIDLQRALHKSRIERQKGVPTKIDNEPLEDNDDDMGESKLAGNIVLNSTAEFCRTLGDIPTYGQAGNRDEDEQELYDLELEMKAERSKRENMEALMNNWNEVEMSDAKPVEVAPTEVPILDAEPDISSGVAGALKMAIVKGYIQTEEEKRPSASRFAHLQAQNYSIEDKAFAMEDDKHSRRERYCGSTTEFKEKDGYKPNVKLEYIDDDGHILSSKEAFRYLSHKFHGKGPGKNKIEKRMKKNEQEALMKQMSSTDTPLGTLNMLQQKQKETQSAFVVLSGSSKHGQSTSIAKMKL